MKAMRDLHTLPLPYVDTVDTRARAPHPVLVTDKPPPAQQPEARRRQAWLAIRLTQLPLTAALRAMSETERAAVIQRPLALVDEDRFRSVLCCNDLAHTHGIRPGHRLNAAIALCSQLHCLPRATALESEVLESLAHHCQRFTPTIVIEPPNELLLEVRSSLKLFGGVQALIRRVEEDLTQQHIVAAIAVSRTLRSAQWFARCTRASRIVTPDQQAKALAQLPMAVLLWPQDVRERLRRFGITRVGELLRLPRGGLARRIGHRLLQELDQAQGRTHDVRASFVPREAYRDRILLDFEIETLTLAESVLSHRLQRLERFLRRRDATIRELAIHLVHRDRPATRIALGLAAATADLGHLRRLLHETLNGLTLPAPIREMHIEVPRCLSATARTRTLTFSPHARGEREDIEAARARLIEQLRARLGANRIRAIRALEDRRPEQTQQMLPAQPQWMIDAAPLPHLPPRPLWLLREPQPLTQQQIATHGLRLGPERIQSGWWDAPCTDREYFVMRSRSGALGWVYRDAVRQGRWFLQGLFA